MNRRWMALGAAALMTASLASCGMSHDKTGTSRLSSQGEQGSGYRTSAGTEKHDFRKDGRYYAQGDGSVTPYQGESELDKLGRALREGWDELMKGAEDTARDTGKAAEKGLKDTRQDLKQAGRDMTGK